LLNNYGLLLQDIFHDYQEAIFLFSEAVRLVKQAGGGYGYDIMKNNLAIAIQKYEDFKKIK